MASTLRVRQILEGMDSVQRASLKKLLPAKLKMPEVETARYPSALLGCFPDGETYSYLGIVAENLLRLPAEEIGLESLVRVSKEVCPSFGATQEAKVRKSVTTAPFLECLVATRQALEGVLCVEAGALEFEPTLTSGSVEGHPDMKNRTQVFEVKLTGMLKTNWTSFLLQVFAYGALDPAITDLYLVLPLQKTVWHVGLAGWKKRGAYLDALKSWSSHEQTTGFETALMAMALCQEYRIGCHVGKQKVLATTLASLGDYSRPYQIFLGGPQSSKLSIGDDDLAASLGVVTKTRARVFVHSQYIINLCAVAAADAAAAGAAWHTDLLVKNLQYTRAFGGQGVVVHVGKSVASPVPEALERMRSALTVALEHATTDCPLLLETPAGQGTETLKGMGEFLDFVESFADPRLRICLDTCHVFACGHKPLEYVEAALARPGLLKLIHFNDSLGECGSCVDRHAAVGAGKIGFEGMEALASVCAAAGLPMLVE
jgi:deoxyribonuclease IV